MTTDDRIASILGEWIEQRDQGESVDPDEVIAAHPDLADELRRRFKALSLMEDALGDETAAGRLRPLPAGRYGEFKVTGEGGMGIVYWALDSDLNRQVAFKIVRPDVGGGRRAAPSVPIGLAPPTANTPASQAFETLKARFLQEAWVTAGLEHPGIVPVYELGETPDGVPYYTMRFVRGSRTLASAIEEAGEQSIEERLALLEPFLRVCDTIRYAHAHGVIHRDLKPDNVALGEFGEVVVLDWGLAKMKDQEDATAETWQERLKEYREASDLQTMASALGTPGYMSPEAALGRVEQLDERGDVYSLGAMLFQILTGRLPFKFKSYIDLVMLLTEETAPPATEFEPAVPDELAAICAKALAKEREDRYPSPGELSEAIRTWQRESAREREVRELLAKAEAAFEGTEGLEGEALLKQLDRVTAACGRITDKAPDQPGAAALTAECEGIRTRAITEREKAARGRILKRVGALAAVLLIAIGVVVVLLVNQKRREAETARAEADRTLRKVRALALASASREALGRDPRLALALAHEASRVELLPDVRNAIFDAGLAMREVAVFDVGSPVRWGGCSPAGDRIVTAHEDGVARLWALDGRPLTGMKGHEGALTCVDFSPDGDLIATASEDGTARLWDRNGILQAVLGEHTDKVVACYISTEGDRALTVCLDGKVFVWNTSGEKQGEVENPGNVYTLTVSPRRDRFVTHSRGSNAALYDFSGRRVAGLGKKGLIQVLFAPGGDRFLATAGFSRRIHLYGSDGAVLSTFELEQPAMLPPAFSPSGDHILALSSTVITSDRDKSQYLTVIDVVTGRVRTIPVPLTALTAVFSPSGDRILMGQQDGTGRIIDLEGKEVALLRGHTGAVAGADFMTRDGLPFTVADDRTARLWSLRQKQLTGVVMGDPGLEGAVLSSLRGHTAGIAHWDAHPDGRHLLTISHDGTARLWNLTDPTYPQLRGHTRALSQGGFSPSGDLAVTASNDETVRLWDVSGEQVAVIRRVEPHSMSGGRLGVHSASFDDGGQRILVAPVVGKTRIWDREGEELAVLPRPEHVGETVAAFLLADGRVFTAYDLNHKHIEAMGEADFVFLCDLDGGATTPDAWSKVMVKWAVLSPKGDRILTARDKWDRDEMYTRLVLRDLDGRELATFTGHEKWLFSASFSPSGDRVLTASEDKTARLWDLRGNELAVFTGHTDGVRSAVLSPSEDLVLTTSGDRTARLWDPAGRPIVTLHHGDDVTSAEFSPDGRRVLTASRDRVARIWSLDGVELAALRGHDSPLVDATWSPAGDRILTTALDGTARLWPGDDEELLRLAERRAGAGISVKEKAQYADLLGDVKATGK